MILLFIWRLNCKKSDKEDISSTVELFSGTNWKEQTSPGLGLLIAVYDESWVSLVSKHVDT